MGLSFSDNSSTLPEIFLSSEGLLTYKADKDPRSAFLYSNVDLGRASCLTSEIMTLLLLFPPGDIKVRL